MSVAEIRILQNRIAELEAGVSQLISENTCDVCFGEPLKNGKPCMCKGTGKMSVAAIYLREQLYKKEQILARFDTTIEHANKLLQEYKDAKEKN